VKHPDPYLAMSSAVSRLFVIRLAQPLTEPLAPGSWHATVTGRFRGWKL